MNITVIAIVLAFFALACDSVETPPGAADAQSHCEVPTDYVLVLAECPGTQMSTCLAQNSAYVDAPAGTTKIDLTGCHLAIRPDVVCVAACPPR